MKDITEVYFYGGYKTTGGQTHEEQFSAIQTCHQKCSNFIAEQEAWQMIVQHGRSILNKLFVYIYIFMCVTHSVNVGPHRSIYACMKY